MKKIFLILTVVGVISSCKKLSDLNVDPKNPSTAPSYSFFTNAQRELMNALTTSNVNVNIFRLIVQYWQETTYTDESNYILSHRTINDIDWSILYSEVLRDLQEARNLIPNDVPDPVVRKNQLVITGVMEVIAWYYLVTTFGNIPYTQALDISKPFPVYDDAKTIYNNLLTRLDADI